MESGGVENHFGTPSVMYSPGMPDAQLGRHAQRVADRGCRDEGRDEGRDEARFALDAAK